MTDTATGIECVICPDGQCDNPGHLTVDGFEVAFVELARRHDRITTEKRRLQYEMGRLARQAQQLGVTSQWMQTKANVAWLTLARWTERTDGDTSGT